MMIKKKGKRNTRSWKMGDTHAYTHKHRKKDGKKIIIFNLKRHNIKIK